MSLEKVFFPGMTRCVATEVNPATPERHLDIVPRKRAFGHTDIPVCLSIARWVAKGFHDRAVETWVMSASPT